MNKTNKVLVGVGIGCGSLVLLGMIALGVGAWWLKRQVGDSVSTLVESGQKMEALGQELQALDKSHPFTPPLEGEVLALSEARLRDYLAVRETALPVYEDFQKKAEAFEAEHKDNEDANLRAAMQATGMLTELMAKVQGAYIEGLKKQNMSPREFRTITQTLYSSVVTGTADQVQQMSAELRQQALESVREQLEEPSLTEEQRADLEAQEQELLAAAEEPAQEPALSEASKTAAAANLVLMEKYKDRINSAGSLAMDSLLVGGDVDVSDNVARDHE
jgi:hypothetical protein